MKFNELGLSGEILKAVDEMGYEQPSPIQEQAIPIVLTGRDMVGCAQTGTGKTAAFAMPILQSLMKSRRRGKRNIRTLILTPTRELALQIFENFQIYGKHLPLRTGVLFGGVGQNPQVEMLKQGIDILVATPGRLNDLYNQGFVDLSHIEIFVLDEADRMLDMGFVHDVKRVITRIPAKRQTLLFSATMPSEIKNLVAQILTDPAYVEVAPVSSTADTVSQEVYFVDKANKKNLLVHLLDKKKVSQVLVFTKTKHGANRVVKELAQVNILAAAIHGNKSQSARQAALAGFKSGELRVLVATDIAARGIDIKDLPLVINYDLPDIPETYVHRIGRTGRAGVNGDSLSFCNFDEIPLLRDIEKLMHKSVPVVEIHPYPMMIMEASPKKPQGRPQGRPQGKPQGRRHGNHR